MTDAAEWQVGDVIICQGVIRDEIFHIDGFDRKSGRPNVTCKKYRHQGNGSCFFLAFDPRDGGYYSVKNITALERELAELKREKGLNSLIESGQEVEKEDFDLYGVGMD